MATTFTVEVDWTKTGTWVDETSRTRRVKCWAGFKAPGDPVAAVGRCVLTLDNSAQRFSPGNTAGALFGNLLPMRPVRVKATSGSTWTLFRGFIDRILPDVGKYGGQECVLECVDALAILAAQRASVVYAASKTVKDTVIALVESVYAPPAEDIVDNGDLVAHYGRAWRPEDIDIDGALREVCDTYAGRFCVARDGTATYKVRERLQDPGIVPALKPGVTYTDNLRLLKPGHLLACWPLDEASGAVAYDSSGNARNGANTGVTPGAAGIGDGATVYSFDGVGDRVNVYSASLAGAFHAEEGTLLAWVKVSAAGIWTDGAYHWCVNLGVDSNNRVLIFKSSANGVLELRYVAGGSSKAVQKTSMTETGWMCVAITWSKSADQVKAYYNGVQSGSTLTGLGTWAGALAATGCALGAQDSSGSNCWNGVEGRVALWDLPLTSTEIATAYTVFQPVYADDLEVVLDTSQLVNRAHVTVYPVETVAVATELWRARSVLRIPPGQTRIVNALFANDEGERCGAVNVVDPVATTDYLVFENSDGTGFNYTSDPAFGISFATEATRMAITLTNSAIGPLYVTLLKVRGQPLNVYDPLTFDASDAASIAAYATYSKALDLLLLADEDFGESYATWLVQRFKTPVMGADQLTVRDQDSIGSANVFSVGLLDQVSISDTQTGARVMKHWVRAVEYDLAGGSYLTRLHLERADDLGAWLLGEAGFGELGTVTWLGF